MIDNDMPISLWCEFGGWENGHSFSSKDPDYQVYRQTRKVPVPTGNSFGRTTYQDREEVTDTIVICGQHLQQMSRSIQGPRPEDNQPEKVEALEKEDAEYRRGFEAGVDHALYATG